jgi:hypothetical protein
VDDQAPQPAGKPGKLRTWWHPLLARLLRWQLGNHYKLEEEVPVGQKPLQIDLLLLRKQEGELPQQARRVLAGLAEYLNELTLIELKSPSDTLRAGDFQTFLAYALLYRAQNQPLLPPERMHLVVVAPRLTRPYRDELRVLGVTPREERPGAWALEGGVVSHRTWVLETEALAGLDHPLLTLFSPEFLRRGPQTYTTLRQAGYTQLVVYMAQQIHQFDLAGEEFAMQHMGTEDEMRQVLRDLIASLPPEERFAGLAPEERLAGLAPEDRLAGLPPEERMAGLPPEQRMAGLSPEQRLQGLTPEELEQLRKLLHAPEDKGGPSDSR